jgi:hypothetical protein
MWSLIAPESGPHISSKARGKTSATSRSVAHQEVINSTALGYAGSRIKRTIPNVNIQLKQSIDRIIYIGTLVEP